jgi:hypothetical protein
VDVEAAGVEANDSVGTGSALAQKMGDGLSNGFSPLSLDGYECAKGDDEGGVEVKRTGSMGVETEIVLFWYITEWQLTGWRRLVFIAAAFVAEATSRVTGAVSVRDCW